MSIVKRLFLTLFILVACVGCDQASKFYAEAKLPKAQPLSFLADTVRLQVTHNDGAFLSLGASLPKTSRVAVLRVGAGAMLVALFAYTLFAAAPRPSFIVGLALILAGGTSNLIDRFVHGGYVVDFINLGVGPIRTGIFNVADIAITVGVLTLFAQSWRGKSRASVQSVR